MNTILEPRDWKHTQGLISLKDSRRQVLTKDDIMVSQRY
jgi:hypothetical protein